MRSKKWVITALLFVMVIGTGARVYAVRKSITVQDIENVNDKETKQKITEVFLSDGHKGVNVNPEEAGGIEIVKGNFTGTEGIVVSVEFGSKLTLISVYEKNGKSYRFIDDLGSFLKIESIMPAGLKPEGKDLIFIKENANQTMGSYENTDFMRGYFWNGGNFELVFNIPSSIDSQWYDVKDDGSFLWRKVLHKSVAEFENGNEPNISRSIKNEYYTCSCHKSEVPEDKDFQLNSSNETEEVYYWSGEWKRFILAEGIDKTTQEAVAVIEDWESQPYALVPQFEDNKNKVRVVRRNGTVSVADKNNIDILNE
ncbi:hypothetical protein NE664_10275 [Anaerotignum faecicola]|nr:hypothetical protein [Anaerotignum faecicola]